MGDDTDSYFVGSTTYHWYPFYKCFFDELLNSSYNAEGEYIFKNNIIMFEIMLVNGLLNCILSDQSRFSQNHKQLAVCCEGTL